MKRDVKKSYPYEYTVEIPDTVDSFEYYFKTEHSDGVWVNFRHSKLLSKSLPESESKFVQ